MNEQVAERLDRVRLFRALGDPSRLDMVRKLRDAGGELACSSLIARCGISRTASSYHYKELEQAGVITRRKQGQHVTIALNRDALERELPGLLRNLD